MTKLVVVIVSWNTVDLTRDCLRTLFTEIAPIDHEVWMVDNDSRDDSAAMVRREFPSVKLIQNRTNVGFAKANNQILSQAEGEYYLLLNTDTIIPQDSIRKLIQFMDENPDAGAAGPKLKNALGAAERGLKPLPTLGGEIRYCLASHFYPLNSIFQRMLAGSRNREESTLGSIEAEVLSAACLIIRREVIKKVGLLAEDYFLFSEENDYFYRMKQAGFRGYYLPQIEVIHLIGMSRKKRQNFDSDLNFFKSRMLFFRKFHPGIMPLFKLNYYFFFVWSYTMAGLKGFLKRPPSEENYAELYCRLLGILRRGGRE
ncbi:putative Glycosyl transferase family 2 [Candidatus Zixiibacteriota bacterium]|nr:putative Glycosyl transferase family 2 [candidate division Zixibacteria bacterium]